MKKSLTVFSFIILIWCLPLDVVSQSIYKGQIVISKKDISVSDGSLHVSMQVDYNLLKLAPNESLTLTPVVRDDSHQLKLPPILINGSLKQKMYHRDEVLSQNDRVYKSKSTNLPVIIVESDSNSSCQFIYQSTVNYNAWMKNAILLISTRECGCNGKPADVYEDKIADGVVFPPVRFSYIGKDVDSQYLEFVNVIPLTDGEDTTHFFKGTIPYWGG